MAHLPTVVVAVLLPVLGAAACGASEASGVTSPRAATEPAVAPTTPEESRPMMIVRVVIDVVPEQREAFEAYLREEARSVRELAGCERYELFQDPNEPGRYLLYEEWATPADFDAYRNSEALRRSFAVLGPMMAGAPDSAYYEAVLPVPQAAE